MKKWLFLLSMISLGAAWNSTAFAFGGEQAFFDFLGEHPRIRHELEANPNLVNNPAYLRDHPQFIEFFRNHDEVRRELERNAPEIMHREEIDMAQRHKPE